MKAYSLNDLSAWEIEVIDAALRDLSVKWEREGVESGVLDRLFDLRMKEPTVRTVPPRLVSGETDKEFDENGFPVRW